MTRYLSLCSGIESASVAWHPLGWQPVAFAEIEPFPCAVLAHHYPDVKNLGDMTAINGSAYRGTVDLIAGGTPCQSFSVAGKRGGISDPRGALALAFVEMVRDVSPRWIVWENVPGVFSSGDGADFKAFASALVDIGYPIAWRVLDAQYFGVPQRRRRVYLVGHLGDWLPAAAVLFEPHSLRGHSAARRKKAQNIAGTIEAGSARRRGSGMNPAQVVAYSYTQSSHGSYREGTGTVRASGGDVGGGSENIVAFHGSQDPDVYGTVPHPLRQNQEQEVCIAFRDDPTPKASSNGKALTLITPSPSGGGNPQCVAHGAHKAGLMHVRRLTPLECERLQGFPDHYTAIAYKGKPAADGPRYKALGNSMAVPVMRWIGERITAVSGGVHCNKTSLEVTA